MDRSPAISFIVVLPIALPGIITGVALISFFVAGGIGLVVIALTIVPVAISVRLTRDTGVLRRR